MAIKDGNTRISITLTPTDMERLEYLLSLKNTNKWWNLETKTDLITTLIRNEYAEKTYKKENEG